MAIYSSTNVFHLHCVLFVFVLTFDSCYTLSYDRSKAIFDDKLSDIYYHKDVRPVIDQSKPLQVNVSYNVRSIVDVWEVDQTFLVNGFFVFSWIDERLAWDPDDYGGETLISPETTLIWKPRLLLLNTRGDRDTFKDDNAPLTVSNTGLVTWLPGKVLATACTLDMRTYPFDKHLCSIKLSGMGWGNDRLVFVNENEKVLKTTFFENSEWELVDAKLRIKPVKTHTWNASGVFVEFAIARRPISAIISVIIPVALLSVLNISVFLIPVESGEKISYGITVYLALCFVFYMVGDSLPESSDKTPAVSIYIFVLIVISTLSLLDSIIIVRLYHREIKGASYLEIKSNSLDKTVDISSPSSTLTSVKSSEILNLSKSQRNAIFTVHQEEGFPSYDYALEEENKTKEMPDWEIPTKKKLFSQKVDRISYTVFFVVWIITTLVYIFHVTK